MTNRVLIAEDDRTSRTLLRSMLSKWGFEVQVTEDGAEAWQALQVADAPQLLVLDWMMPGLDGPEICRRLRALEDERPRWVILLTALGQKDDVVAGLEAGADDYLVKPFDASELKARLAVGRRVIELQTALADRVAELSNATAHINTLQGILPICMHCHQIRDDQDSWIKLEQYLVEHSEAKLSHSLCPACLEKYYPEEENES